MPEGHEYHHSQGVIAVNSFCVIGSFLLPAAVEDIIMNLSYTDI